MTFSNDPASSGWHRVISPRAVQLRIEIMHALSEAQQEAAPLSLDTLASALRCSRRTIEYARDELVKHKLIEARDGGSFKPSTFALGPGVAIVVRERKSAARTGGEKTDSEQPSPRYRQAGRQPRKVREYMICKPLRTATVSRTNEDADASDDAQSPLALSPPLPPSLTPDQQHPAADAGARSKSRTAHSVVVVSARGSGGDEKRVQANADASTNASAESTPPSTGPAGEEPARLIEEMNERGVTPPAARRLIARHGYEIVARNFAHFRKQKNAGPGLLVRFIEADAAGAALRAKQSRAARAKQAAARVAEERSSAVDVEKQIRVAASFAEDAAKDRAAIDAASDAEVSAAVARVLASMRAGFVRSKLERAASTARTSAVWRDYLASSLRNFPPR